MNELDVYPCCGRTEAEIHNGDECFIRVFRARAIGAIEAMIAARDYSEPDFGRLSGNQYKEAIIERNNINKNLDDAITLLQKEGL
jgi:hypothetical protein